MLCDRTDRSNADSLSQTGTDNAEVTFCPIPKMLVCALIFDGVCLCVYGFVQYSLMCVCVLRCGILNCKPVQFVCTGNCVGQFAVSTVYSVCMHVCVGVCEISELSVSFLSFCR